MMLAISFLSNGIRWGNFLFIAKLDDFRDKVFGVSTGFAQQKVNFKSFSAVEL
jgi:hypothetical protein